MEWSSVSANDLARACSESGTEEAWQEFVRRFQRPIALAVLRTARCWGSQSSAVVDDLVQETFLRLCADDCRLLKSFVPRGPESIFGYLRVIAANIAHDKLRADRTLKRGGSLSVHEHEPHDLDSVFVNPGATEAIEKSLSLREIDQILVSFVPEVLTERDRTIFWLYFQQGFSAREIGAITTIGLTVKGVESSIHRTTLQVRSALQQRGSSRSATEGISKPFAIYREEL
jgi:RNA polymerase sigma-70 factor, ECF subfamily